MILSSVVVAATLLAGVTIVLISGIGALSGPVRALLIIAAGTVWRAFWTGMRAFMNVQNAASSLFRI